MTDLKLNLKAGNLKRVLAMFMAVCLTVLSVNIPVNAAERKVVDFDETSFKVDFTSSLNGEVSQYDGKVKVDVSNAKVVNSDETATVEAKTTVVTAVNGKIDKQEIEFTISANTLDVQKETSFDLTFSVEGYGPQFVESYVVIQRAVPVDEKAIAKDETNPVVIVSAVDGSSEGEPIDADKALRDDYYSNDVTDIVTYLDAKNKVQVKKDKAYVTVTVLDGKTIKTDNTLGAYTPYNSKTNDGVVAVFQKAAGDDFTQTAKMKAVASNYYEKDGVEQAFGGFVIAEPVTKGNKVLGYKAGTTVFAEMPETDSYVIATWKDAEIADNNTSIDVAVKKSASAQVLPNEGKNGVTKFVYAVDVTLKDGTAVNAAENYKLTKDQKKVISSVKYNAKTDVFTVKAGKENGSATVKILSKDDKSLVAEVNITVHDQKVTSAYNALTIQTAAGAKSVYLDKNTAAKTAQLIALPGNTGVKYVATTKEVDVTTKTFNSAKDANAEIKKFTKDGKTSIKSKAISVAKTGKITAKKAVDETQYVYAYQLVKKSSTEVYLVVSNVVKVDVTATARGLTLKKNTVKKFNNAAKDAYENKKNKEEQIKFTAKTKGESTDKVAILAINSGGKVVLGGKNGLKSVKKGDKVVNGQYYVGIGSKETRTGADNLIIVATSPAGEQKYATLTYQK